MKHEIRTHATKLALIGICLFKANLSLAITPTWTGTSSTTWSTNTNWTTPAQAPGGNPSPFDSAIFTGTAVRTTAANSGTITLDTLQFNSGATVYTITNTGAGNFTFSGSGIVNNSANTQNISNTATMVFSNTADAGSNVTLTTNTGVTSRTYFQGSSTATNTRIVSTGTGAVDISGLTASSITFGSLSGTGQVFMGAKELTVGALDTSTTFSGVLSGVGGQLVKTGAGTLTLSGANTYSGATTISAGTLQIGAGSTTGSINTAGGIVDNSILAVSRSGTVTFGNVVSGTGSFRKLGSSTLLITGDNTYTGGTTISAGTLRIGNAGVVGSIVGDVVDNATLSFNRSNDITFAGNISGTGALTKLLTNKLTLTGTNTFTGTTTISAGTLQIGDGGANGTITGNIVDGAGATLIFNKSDDLTYNGVISSTGALSKLGAGTLTLTGTNTVSGAKTVAAGTLQIGNGGATGSLTGNITNNASVVVNRSDTAFIYSGVMSGTGSLTQSGTGKTTLTGANTYSGGTTISNGTLQIGNNGTTGSVSGSIVNNGALIIDRTTNPLTFSNAVSGTGTFTKLRSNVLLLTGTNTYTGGTTISGGTLRIGNAGTAGSIVGDVVDNATLSFNRSDNITFAGNISGTGAVTKLLASQLTLTGTNTYAGSTTISAGTLQIGEGGDAGSVAGAITNNSALIFNRSGSLTYDSVISGTGTVTLDGSGTITLNGINTYTNATTINSGTLLVGDVDHATARIANNVTANFGTVLGGYGTIGGNVVNNGDVKPAGSVGTLNITGNYTQSSSGSYTVEIDGSTSDLLNVTGSASLNGSLVLDASRGFVANSTYTIITAAGGVSGTFSNASSGTLSQGFITAQVSYLANSVTLALNLNSSQIVQAAVTPNQKSLANYLTSIPTSKLPAAVRNLLASISSDEELDSLLNQMSAATFTNQESELSRIAYGSGFDDELADRFSLFPNCQNNQFSQRANAHGQQYENCNQNYATWLIYQGGNDQIFPGEVSGLDSDHKGAALGAEFPIHKTGAIGAAFSAGHFNSKAVTEEVAKSSGELYQFGLYGRYALQHWLFGASVDGGFTGGIKANRTIELANTEIKSIAHAHVFSEQVRVSYQLFNRAIKPFIGVFNQNVTRNGLVEQGTSGFELRVGRMNYHSFRSQLGLMLDIPTDFMLRFFASAAWEHEFAQNASEFNAQLAEVNSNLYFHIVGAAIGRDVLAIKGGLVVLQGKNWDLSGLYEGQFANQWRENSGRAQLSIRF